MVKKLFSIPAIPGWLALFIALGASSNAAISSFYGLVNAASVGSPSVTPLAVSGDSAQTAADFTIAKGASTTLSHSANGGMTLTPLSTATTPLTINEIAAQSADPFDVINSSSSVVGRITPFGWSEFGAFAGLPGQAMTLCTTSAIQTCNTTTTYSNAGTWTFPGGVNVNSGTLNAVTINNSPGTGSIATSAIGSGLTNDLVLTSGTNTCTLSHTSGQLGCQQLTAFVITPPFNGEVNITSSGSCPNASVCGTQVLIGSGGTTHGACNAFFDGKNSTSDYGGGMIASALITSGNLVDVAWINLTGGTVATGQHLYAVWQCWQ